MAAKKRNTLIGAKKTNEKGEPTPISHRVKIADDIKAKAKELKRNALKVGMLTEEESLGLASQMALGLVSDRFGLEMSIADRLKALQIVTSHHEKKSESGNSDEEAPHDITISIVDAKNDKRIEDTEKTIK